MVRAMFNKRFFRLAALLVCVFGARFSYAHPMGNFSVNHYSRITLGSDGIEIQYILDLAEIPTYQEMQQGNFVANLDDPKVLTFVAAQGEELGRRLNLVLDGKSMPLRLLSKDVLFPPGAGGLPTMKMGFVYRAAYPAGAKAQISHLTFEDWNFAGHAGWKEIIVTAPEEILISSSAPAKDRSAELSNYPTDLLNSPPQDLTASIQFKLPTSMEAVDAPQSSQLSTGVRRASSPSRGQRPLVAGSAAAAASRHSSVRAARAVEPKPATVIHVPSPATPLATGASMHLKANQQATPRSAFTELITSGRLGFWFLLTAAFIAFGLGALHALEPGHGKTIVAAYLVGSRGTVRHAALLGIIVTASHTAGVFALGAITLYASRFIVPERLYPWLGVFSGLMIAGLGGYMFLRRWIGQEGEHTHAIGQPHSHWFSAQTQLKPLPQDPAALRPGQDRSTTKSVSLSQLFILGITGGILPCPAALVVLLSALALHRLGLGLFLIVAFSLGLAAVLIGFGMLMVYARQFMTRFKVDGPFATRWMPVASAAFMTILGAGITMQALATTGLHIRLASKAELGPFLLLSGLGLILGMRHSTDPDHVVAVSTIVSKQRSIRHAALIGMFWGLGHTLTIFVVGCLIILFGVVIPPRIGLSMEFSVALMLILLGVLNLTGLMRKITQRLHNMRKPEPKSRAFDQANPCTGTEALLDRTIGHLGVYQCMRPLVIGIVHGLAGSAAVALLVLSTIRSPIGATGYLLVFGAGTMLGMMCMTTAMAVPLAYAGNRFTQVSRYLGVASGLVSLCFGAFLVYQLGFLGGLFTSHPQWTPR
ncbi:MAG TPA: sulfite exporter TauE/SafE family protein [Acidobacteriaceae bacterium]